MRMKCSCGTRYSVCALQCPHCKKPNPTYPITDEWTPDRIREEFDNNPNLRVSTLARISGLTGREVKTILLDGLRWKWMRKAALRAMSARQNGPST
mgnify:CR=1 FL=1